MKFKIDDDILKKFPGLNIGIAVAKSIDNTGSNDEIMKLIREREKEIRSNLSTEKLSQNLKIEAWRKAYSSFGAKPKKYKCSVENLYRMILKGIDLKHINKIVDVYNYISIKHTIPLGGDDIDKVDGGIRLKFADGDEPFVELNSQETFHPKQGEVVYADEKEILCRRWNWRECDKSKMTEETKNAALVVEGLSPFSKEDVERIIDELKELVQKYCGGEVQTFILNESMNEIDF
jgi:DNA/RNA-binding domain of Phe-tRNA-synthetase-like protein